jgi:hypothetical protein
MDVKRYKTELPIVNPTTNNLGVISRPSSLHHHNLVFWRVLPERVAGASDPNTVPARKPKSPCVLNWDVLEINSLLLAPSFGSGLV